MGAQKLILTIEIVFDRPELAGGERFALRRDETNSSISCADVPNLVPWGPPSRR